MDQLFLQLVVPKTKPILTLYLLVGSVENLANRFDTYRTDYCGHFNIMSMINFVLNLVEHEEYFITSFLCFICWWGGGECQG